MAETIFPPEPEYIPDEPEIEPVVEADEVALPPRRVHPSIRFDRVDVLVYGLLAVVLAVAAWLRLDAQNWDDYTHLHPDERFMTDVVSVINGPLVFSDKSVAEQEEHRIRCERRYPLQLGSDEQAIMGAGRGSYFDADCSPLNPNNVGKGTYVYGEFPLFTVHIAGVARSHLSRDYHTFLETFDPAAAENHAITTHWEGYVGAQLVGRTLAAVSDWLTVIVLFLLGRRLYGCWPGLIAAALYGVAAFPIQQSHFWTVDAFTTFWVALALYFAVRALDNASTIRGPVPLVYLAVWAGGVMWETGYWERPVLGLVSMGVLALATILVTMAFRFDLRVRLPLGRWPGGDLLVVASGVIAPVIYLVAWTLISLFAPRDFPLQNDLLALGLASLFYGLTVLATYYVAVIVRRRMIGFSPRGRSPAPLAIGGMGMTWMALVIGLLAGGLAPWAALMVVLASLALLVTDLNELTDYALFGLALGGAVASRINIAPLAGVIGLVALVRVLPAFDRRIGRLQRSRLLAYAMTGVFTAAVVSFIVFRLLQPHAFAGPSIFGIKFNPGWREDTSDAAYMTSGDWDAPPNHQWASRTPYFFAWRNIVLWGTGIPLGLVAWGAWAWAGGVIVLGRRDWTRHLIPFAWILVCFGWLAGRWVTTMRYFLPIYPPLILFGAWAVWRLLVGSWRAHPVLVRRFASAGAALLLIVVVGYTTVYGFAFHNIHRHQLTRVAASRWFQENVPADFGIWVEGDDGSRQLVNIGYSQITPAPVTTTLNQGEMRELTFSVPGESTLTTLTLHRLYDPLLDEGDETVRVRLFRDDLSQGRKLLFEDEVSQDFAGTATPYGTPVILTPDDEIVLSYMVDSSVAGASTPQDSTLPPGDPSSAVQTQVPLLATYILQITVTEGGPLKVLHSLSDIQGVVTGDFSVGLRLALDSTLTSVDLSLEGEPILTGHGDDIPASPTHWTPGGNDALAFTIPIDGEIREIEIPHLGDPLRDPDDETLTLTVMLSDGRQTSATITADFAEGADPLGQPRTLTFDPPLRVRRLDEAGNQQMATLLVQAADPVYTSGPVIAWEGDWDDAVPWPVCPLPLDVQYRDDLPSGMSSYTCASIGMWGGYYQGLKLWMVAEDNEQKYGAMTNALDQADYLVITSNRFYDSLTRVPMRWPMTKAFYEALFEGQMGFEIVRVFESPPTLGPFTIRDQILPTDDLPDWLNEHWEAEEAFHVYDHPVVFVFRKTDAYSPENTRAVLNSVSLRAASTAYPTYVVDPEPVGVVPWGAKQASEAPTMLEFTEDQWEIQHDGGTWSDLFDLDSLINENQVVAVIVWWLLMVIAGWLAWPLLFAILPALPDRAYPAAKIAAWLIVAWVAWVGGTLHLLAWTQTGIAVILVGLGLLSGAVVWRRRTEFTRYIRANWRHLLMIEGLALVLYLVFVGVRLGNPDLWHMSFGGEKPMDFAYFNGVLRSTIFPPIDPWYSQGYLNYYYFGYVIVGAPVKLLGLNPSIAYNLILPALYSMSGLGVFCVAYNWVRSRTVEPGAVENVTRDVETPPVMVIRSYDADAESPVEEKPQRAAGRRLPGGSAWLAGVCALLLAMVMGNLGTALVIVREVAKLDGWTQPQSLAQVRQQELDTQRATIYQDYYDDEIKAWRKDHDGQEPTAEGDILTITQAAQIRTDAYIKDEVKHPPLTRVWKYGLDNLRTQIAAFFGGLDDALKGKPLQMAPHRWYWAPTRIIAELPGGGGNAIAEMPYFTFLYGDLHAHMIAMPLTMLALLWLLAEMLGAGHGLRRWWEAGLAMALGGITVGLLRPTNSWDWVTYLILGAAALTYAAWLDAARSTRDTSPSRAAARVWDWIRPGRLRDWWPLMFVFPAALAGRIAYYFLRRMQADEQAKRLLQPGEAIINPTLTGTSVILWIIGGLVLVMALYFALVIALRVYINKPRLLRWIGRVALFLGFTVIGALPFNMYFATAYNSIDPWKAERTPLWAYLYIHGTFIFIVISFLIWQTVRLLRRVKVSELQGLIVPVGLGLVALVGAVLVSIVAGVRSVPVLQLAGPLIAWAAVLFFVPRQHPLVRPIYALIVLALAITVGVEVIVIAGDIGRQNTVFKFYIQAWFFLSVAGGVVLAWLWHNANRWSLGLRALWQIPMMILFVVALMYPVMATQGRFQDRFNKADTPLTLDGMEYMKNAVHGEHEVWFGLDTEYRLIRWMQENVEGTPVVMEAHLYTPLYHWSGRVSIYTGLPTILGWDFHQTQQRSLPQMSALVHTRQNNVAAFYELSGTEGIRTAWNLIRHYDVEYIVVAVLERAFYDDIQQDLDTGLWTAGHAPGLAKFEQMADLGLLEVVYEEPDCLDVNIKTVEECPAESVYNNTIYRVVPGASLGTEIAGQ